MSVPPLQPKMPGLAIPHNETPSGSTEPGNDPDNPPTDRSMSISVDGDPDDYTIIDATWYDGDRPLSPPPSSVSRAIEQVKRLFHTEEKPANSNPSPSREETTEVPNLLMSEEPDAEISTDDDAPDSPQLPKRKRSLPDKENGLLDQSTASKKTTPLLPKKTTEKAKQRTCSVAGCLFSCCQAYSSASRMFAVGSRNYQSFDT